MASILISFYFRGLYLDVNPILIRRDIEGLAYVLMGISLARFFHYPKAVNTIAKYLFFSLWFSFIVLLLDQLGIPLTQRYGSRVSFNYSNEINLDRVVTPTLFLAWIAICYGLLKFVERTISIKVFLVIILPSISIALISGTRLTLLFLLLPAVANLFFLSFNFKKSRLLLILISFFSLGLLITLVTPGGSKLQVSQYAINLLERSAIVTSDKDGSFLYRGKELARGVEALDSKPLLGHGPGANFLDSESTQSIEFQTLSPTEWIRVNSGTYVHSTPLHLGIKFGLPFMLLVILVLSKRLIACRKYLIKEPAVGVTLVGLLIASFFWNTLIDPGAIASIVLIFGFLGYQHLRPMANTKESCDQEIDSMGR